MPKISGGIQQRGRRRNNHAFLSEQKKHQESKLTPFMLLKPRKVSFEEWCILPAFDKVRSSSTTMSTVSTVSSLSSTVSSLSSGSALEGDISNSRIGSKRSASSLCVVEPTPKPDSQDPLQPTQSKRRSLRRPTQSICLSSMAETALSTDAAIANRDADLCSSPRRGEDATNDEVPDSAPSSPSSWGHFVDVVPLDDPCGESQRSSALTTDFFGPLSSSTLQTNELHPNQQTFPRISPRFNYSPYSLDRRKRQCSSEASSHKSNSCSRAGNNHQEGRADETSCSFSFAFSTLDTQKPKKSLPSTNCLSSALCRMRV